MWKSKTLVEVCNIYGGNSINKQKKAERYTDVDGMPYIATKDVSFEGNIDYANGIAIPELEQASFKVAPENTVFICAEGGSAGRKIAFSDRRVCFVNKLFALVAKEELYPKFVYYYTLSAGFQIQFKEALTGIIGGVSQSKMKKFQINFPNIEEQKQIVEILDETFAGVDQTFTNTENNFQSIQELFDSYLNTLFVSKGKEYESIKLKELCTKITDGVHKKPTYVEHGVPFIKINNLTAGAGISFDPVSYISKEDHELFSKRTNPEKGDILISKDGTIGVVRVVDTDIEFSLFVSVALIKPTDKSVSSFLKYVLESPLIQNQIKPQGAALKHLYLKDLREYLIPVVPKVQQDAIVKKLNSLSSKVEEAELIYTLKLEALKELKQSLLQKAFAGELTSDTRQVA